MTDPDFFFFFAGGVFGGGDARDAFAFAFFGDAARPFLFFEAMTVASSVVGHGDLVWDEGAGSREALGLWRRLGVLGRQEGVFYGKWRGCRVRWVHVAGVQFYQKRIFRL